MRSYWNVFKDWRFNLKEPTPTLTDWEVLERKKNAQNVGVRKREEVVLDQEDYFEDWRQNLVPRKLPQKKRRALEQEDHMMIWNQIFDEKRKSRGRKKKAKRELEQEDFFEDWRQNLEVKSHRQMKKESHEMFQEDYFVVWRQVFLDPTMKARKMKTKNGVLEQEDFFKDWRNNLVETPKKIAEKRDRSQEDYFEDWRHIFEERDSRHRRRSVDELEEDELIIVASPFKKIKQDCQAKKRAVEKTMAYKFGRAYQGMKRNFMIAVGNSKLKDNFDFWTSDSAVESLINSRKEFCQLRFEMRKQRQVNREMNDVIAPESWFEDWRWNMDDERVGATARRRASDPIQVSPEKIFSDWRRISLDPQSSPSLDEFSQWMKNLKERVVKKRRPKTRPDDFEMKEKLTSPVKPSTSNHKFGGILVLPHVPSIFQSSSKKKESKSLKHPQTGKAPADKNSMRLMTKCHAKQPNFRGRN